MFPIFFFFWLKEWVDSVFVLDLRESALADFCWLPPITLILYAEKTEQQVNEYD